MQKQQDVLSSDGIDRQVIRGPEMLTADAETSMGMTRNQVLADGDGRICGSDPHHKPIWEITRLL